MSDDEDECQLQIDESPSSDEKPIAHVYFDVAVVGSPVNEDYKKPDPFIGEKPGETSKEEGEIDEDEEKELEQEMVQESCYSDTENRNGSREENSVELMDSSTENCVPSDGVLDDNSEALEDIKGAIEQENVIENSLKSEDVLMESKFEEITKTPKKKKENRNVSNVEKYNEKRKSGVETIAAGNAVTPHRSKRASHQMASVAIAAHFDDDEHVVQPSAETMPSNPPSTKKQKKDASTNVGLNKGVDTTDMSDTQSIMDLLPGSSIFVEITVLHRTKDHLAFKLKNGELFGFLNDGLPPMHAAIAKKKHALMGNGEETSRESRSNSVGSNGRSARGGSQSREVNSSKSEKRIKAGDLRKKTNSTKDEDEEIDVCSDDWSSSKDPELREIDTTTMHDCHYDGCYKRFSLSIELEYHILKTHKKKVVMYESICCQTEAISGDKCEKSTEIDELLLPSTPMPVLKKETPNKTSNDRVKTPQYSDLSDDDEPEKNEQSTSATVKLPTVPTPIMPAPLSASATLMGFAAHNANPSSSNSVIGINPSTPQSREVRLSTQIPQQQQPQPQQPSQHTTPQLPKQQQQQRTPFMSNSPRQNAQGILPGTPNVLQPAHPMQFLPGFHNMIHSGMLGGVAIDPRSTPMSRAPSRQDAGHKIHELAKSKESQAMAERVGPSTPKVAPSPSTALGNQQQQQNRNVPPVNFMHQNFMQAGNMHQSNALMQMQMARHLMPQMSQNEILQMVFPMQFAMPTMPPPNPGATFGNHPQQPK